MDESDSQVVAGKTSPPTMLPKRNVVAKNVLAYAKFEMRHISRDMECPDVCHPRHRLGRCVPGPEGKFNPRVYG